MGSTRDKRRLPWHGAAAATFWLVHAGRHVLGGTAHDLLWACNVAVPLLAIGCFLGHAMPCAVAISWLAFGTPMWLLDLATGAGLIVTSPLVHVAAPLVAISALRRLGWPDRAWVFATGGALPLLVASRLLGTTEANPNLAFRVHEGWEGHFRSHPLMLGLLLVVAASVFFAIDAVVRRARGPARTPDLQG